MVDVQVTVRLPSITGLRRDESVNTFAFSGVDDGTDSTAVLNMIRDFYVTSTPAALGSLSTYLGSSISRSAPAMIDFSPIVGNTTLPVIASDTMFLGGGSTTPLPLEVATVLSFGTLIGTGLPLRRQRGRIYLGPLGTNTLNSEGDQPVVASGLVLVMREAAARLRDASQAAGTPWSVWSRADAVLWPIVGGFVDNEFDTQRRRQLPATLRETW